MSSRQSLDRLPTRKGRPAYRRDGRMVGYAVLGPNAKASRASGTFRRPFLRLLPHDRDSQPDGLYAPRIKGSKTERSEGGPPSLAMQELGIQLPL
ncbi:hypothetical protein RKD24_000019 [Streptomyces calvus]